MVLAWELIKIVPNEAKKFGIAWDLAYYIFANHCLNDFTS